MSEASIVNPIGFGLLLAALYMLRFRGWQRPRFLLAYFAFFTGFEWLATHYFLPPDALPSAVGYLCLFLTLPVLVATAFVWRQERVQREGE